MRPDGTFFFHACCGSGVERAECLDSLENTVASSSDSIVCKYYGVITSRGLLKSRTHDGLRKGKSVTKFNKAE